MALALILRVALIWESTELTTPVQWTLGFSLPEVSSAKSSWQTVANHVQNTDAVLIQVINIPSQLNLGLV